MTNDFYRLYNGSAIQRCNIPSLDQDEFLQKVLDAVDSGWRVCSYFGVPAGRELELYALLAPKAGGQLGIASTKVSGGRLPSLTPFCPQLHLFEREIAEQYGVVFENHPWGKPVRFQKALRLVEESEASLPALPGVMDFYQVQGDEIHEVAVGPVHAGIIEPGHFRFQCYGEKVLHLEIALGYQHRGLEEMLIGGPHRVTLNQMETVAGDTTVGHTVAYAMVVEALAAVAVPARAHALRGVAMELERLANHTGDLGAISGDVGFLPTASFCGRIRGDFLNMTAELCGSRFSRGLIVPGGVGFDCTPLQADALRNRVAAARRDLSNATELMWHTPSALGRLEGTGRVSEQTALDLGLVGPAARACGVNRDVRRDHPFGIYSLTQIPVETLKTGDVFARAMVRWLEAEKSLDYLDEQLKQLPAGNVEVEVGTLACNHMAIALTEGWRGEVCHVALTDERGRFSRYKIVDPSFHNWSGLAMALRNEQISDFPLCNKSFNLSYCGFDL
ncbi:NADH-quinone oxidoreductase subunit C [Geomonas sp. RF6]|uniref:hydrogenase large subunit n=1 Tax=Geomonas sp. RF6 TaxID=2897342 RepID=UPI001E567924|nr:NADH-quinone oxidoreductase subunit C [Geomonas sp. RF6]UFS68792.1 NADH-quinone oxidoreductase subunit C [Geomonas sp. RF6]